ncbi:MAG TPA: alpha/beta hydrolase, partial [Acidimicrobiales bacterium]|nr:alpha/beta hydrolase [Acidimicrobiales bacterium]
TTIDGQRIHFIHARAEDPGALPLLVLHGWPGSVTEMVKIIEPLRAPVGGGADAADSFHVVCASLPGFGFSGPTHERGWHPRRIAAAMVVLMDRLGYPRFGCLGGDWGATTSNYMALDFPERLSGLYLTMVATGPPEGSDGSELSDEEQQWLAASAAFFAEESGYLQMQGTRPQTLAYALNDSPAGLAGWIVEKFRAWSDCDGDLEKAISRDDVLADITLYWVTGTANSASRLYLEAMRAGQFQPIPERIEVPTGAAIFPQETVKSPRAWAEQAWNIKRWTVMPKGGHFAALEVPDLLVDDVRAFYRDLRSATA